jgi:hypothetical protein
LFGWFAENPATTFAQAGPLLVHAGSNALHTRNFRRTKSKNVAGAKPALIVLRKCVTRRWQRYQTKSQNRCDPWITNCEQINSHMVSPGLTDVAVATRRLAVLESSIIVSVRMATLQDSQPPVHRYFASALSAQMPFSDLEPATLASAAPAEQFENEALGFPGHFQHLRSLR